MEATDHLRAFSSYLLRALHLTQGQLDAWYAVRSAVKAGAISEDDAIKRLSRSPHWVGTAMDPESTLVLALDVGDRTWAMAQRVVHHVAQGLAPHCAPLSLTDGFREYLTALLTHCGHWVQPPRRQVTGPAPQPRWMPQPGLLYAQMVKTVRWRRIVERKRHVVFGTKAAVDQVRAACGWQMNTAVVARLNLRLRQRVAALGRRSATLWKSETGLGQQLVLFPVYHNVVLPHASLRQPLPCS